MIYCVTEINTNYPHYKLISDSNYFTIAEINLSKHLETECDDYRFRVMNWFYQMACDYGDRTTFYIGDGLDVDQWIWVTEVPTGKPCRIHGADIALCAYRIKSSDGGCAPNPGER